MAESLYSNSPYLLILNITVLLLAVSYPLILEKKITVKSVPPALKHLVGLGILWNLCGCLGIIFFSGPVKFGTTAYTLRQILFGIQGIAWIQAGLQTYRVGELSFFTKSNGIVNVSRFLGVFTIVVLTCLFIFFPDAISHLHIGRFTLFEESPIFFTFSLVYLVFLIPFMAAAFYQLIKKTHSTVHLELEATNRHLIGILALAITLAQCFDFIVPICTKESIWTGSFHFLIWHQILSVFLAILCGQYYTSYTFKNKGAFWFLRKLISKMEDGIIYFDDYGKIDFASGGAGKLLGFRPEELRGKFIKSILPPNLDFFREMVYNKININVNGEIHSFKIHFFKCRQSLTTAFNIAYFTDLSKTMLLQQNLKTLNEQYIEYTHDLVRYQDRLAKEASIKDEKENVLNTLINALPFRVWYKSEKGVYQKQNQQDLDKQGSLEGTIDAPEKTTIFETQAREKGEVGGYTSYEDKDGNEISMDEANQLATSGEHVSTFDIMYIPIVQGKAPYKTLCIMVDITKQRKLELERNMLREQKALHTRLEELGTMCGGFAHDYNNIIGAQIGFCQLAQEVLPPDSPAYMFVTEALKASERGKTSLNELLDTIRGKTKSATPAFVFAPYMVIDDVVKKISLTLPKTISVHSTELDHNLKIRGVSASLDRILSNLANNAIFAMKETGGTLSFKLTAATLTEQLVTPNVAPIPPGSYAKFEIADTGTGMDSNTLERIFSPFFTTKAPGEGLGLGLSSALRLLKEGNAYFTVQTTLGKGTTFNLYWPIENDSKED